MHFVHVKARVSSPRLADFEAIISQIPCIARHARAEWKRAVNPMIENKGKGNKVRDLHKLNLIEANFNFNNKVIAKTMLECAERNGTLLPEQHGSRKGLRATSLA